MAADRRRLGAPIRAAVNIFRTVITIAFVAGISIMIPGCTP
jgi:hypothetical protein